MTPYEERFKRIKAAVALESVDKIPFVPCGAAFNAKVCGVKMADYLKSMRYNCTVNLRALDIIGGVDGVQATITSPDTLPLIWLSETKVPGRDRGMSDDELWQVNEKELITDEDYDDILSKGFDRWYFGFLKNRLGDPLWKAMPYFLYYKRSEQRFKKAGYPSINMGALAAPFEMYCGGRSLQTFFAKDLRQDPDKIEEVFKVTQAARIKFYSRLLDFYRPFGMWVGAWRGTSSMISPKWFERFCWPYLLELAELCLSKGVTPIFHLDTCWDKGLEYFSCLPKGKCIMALDGTTDIRKAKQVVGDRMCIMGDVPASLLSLATEEEVYHYSQALIRDIGPTGFILSSGCDVPFNAKLENVRMMIRACEN